MATGQDLLETAQAHVAEKYHLGVLVPKDEPLWKGPWDCSEFASWCVYQVCRRLYGCESDSVAPHSAKAFTGCWRHDAEQVAGSRIIKVEEAAGIPGAAVLRYPVPGGYGHIVFSNGRGGTIEAHSSKDGVINGKLADRRWDIGILVPGIDYQTSNQLSEAISPGPATFRFGASQMPPAVVRRIQEALAAKGFHPGNPDGKFGPHTSAAVVAFQIDQGLTPDGEVGLETATKLGVSLT